MHTYIDTYAVVRIAIAILVLSVHMALDMLNTVAIVLSILVIMIKLNSKS